VFCPSVFRVKFSDLLWIFCLEPPPSLRNQATSSPLNPEVIMQDRPSIGELTLAVREFLELEILSTLSDPRLKFRTLVAMNALGMIARESELEELQVRAECSSLLALLGSDGPVDTAFSGVKAQVFEANTDLAKRIRCGQLPEGTVDHLERVTRAKLEVGNPMYLQKYSTVFSLASED
jgi:hypothetical protein